MARENAEQRRKVCVGEFVVRILIVAGKSGRMTGQGVRGFFTNWGMSCYR